MIIKDACFWKLPSLPPTSPNPRTCVRGIRLKPYKQTDFARSVDRVFIMDKTNDHKLVVRATTLGTGADPEAFPELTKLTRSTSPQVRGAAAAAIGEIA